jgi:hypothetical protein
MDITLLAGAFAPLVSLGASPFVSLTVLSAVGSLLNAGTINPESIPFSDALMQLPISNPAAFVVLLIITLSKFGLSIAGASKFFCDVTLGKIEDAVGTVCAIGGAWLVASATTESVAIVPFTAAAIAYAIYYLMKTMLGAADIAALIVSPIPGSTGIFTVAKHILVGLFAWISVANPWLATIIGIILLIIAFFVFRWAKRLERYYRRIYLIPFTNSIFRRRWTPPLVPKKLPRGVEKEFSNISICIEGFFMNKTTALKKREHCYLIRAGNENFIFKKRFLGKKIKIPLAEDVYIEKAFRFVRVYSAHTNLVIRREHRKNIQMLAEQAGFKA